MNVVDLNRLHMLDDGCAPTEPQVDYSTAGMAYVEAVFRNQRQRLIAEIMAYPVVIGCVAWLTDADVLHALATRRHVSIVVQKEDFLRPDLGSLPQWSRSLRRMYDALPSCLDRFELPGILGHLNTASDPTIDAVRCVGLRTEHKAPATPRMHNKFLIFCDAERKTEVETICGQTYSWKHTEVTPRKVWTGSYNLSANAAASWENVVLITSDHLAEAFAREYAQITAFSEQLDWQYVWVEPEYRIGT